MIFNFLLWQKETHFGEKITENFRFGEKHERTENALRWGNFFFKKKVTKNLSGKHPRTVGTVRVRSIQAIMTGKTKTSYYRTKLEHSHG